MDSSSKKTEITGVIRSYSVRSASKRLFHSTKLRFIAAGLANTAIDFFFYNLLIVSLSLLPALASIGSTSAAMTASYLLNKKFVFKADGKILSKQLSRFLAVTIFTQWAVQSVVIAVGVGLVEAFLDIINYTNNVPAWFAPNTAKVAAIAIGTLTNYVLYSRWVFRKK